MESRCISKNAKGGRTLVGPWLCGLREGLWDREPREEEEGVLGQGQGQERGRGQRWRELKSLDFAGLWGVSWMTYAIERHEDLLGVNVTCL